jgi:hypothetical protein
MWKNECLIVVFIISGHPVFSVPKLTIAFMRFLGHTASCWAAYFPYIHIQRLKVTEKYLSK